MLIDLLGVMMILCIYNPVKKTPCCGRQRPTTANLQSYQKTMTTENLKNHIVAQFLPRKMSLDSILLRYQTEPPVLSITLLSFACCHPSVKIAKKMEDIGENDVLEAILPIVKHAH
jgi:hypothetical protein